MGDIIFGFSTGDVTSDSGTASSALGSYPSFSMRSASSFAFFSAASKSIVSPPPIFLTPSFWFFFAPRTLAFLAPPVVAVFLRAEDVVVREAAGPAPAERSFSAPFIGDLERESAPELAPGLRNGDAVRLITGGVCVREGGLLGRLMAGLSQEEKKSSEGSLLGVEEPSAKVGERTSVTSTSSGDLEDIRRVSGLKTLGVPTLWHR